MFRFRTASVLLCLFIFNGFVFAQEFRATVSGRVTDPNGGGINNAKIVAAKSETGEAATASTSGEGDFTVPFLIPGAYTISVEAPGFKKSVRDGIELHVHDKTTVNFTMELGQVQDTVTVTAEAPILESATATRGNLIENLRVTELPLNGRNPFTLANLSPGVVFAGNPQFTRPFDNGDNANFSINGGLRQTNEYLIDGAPDNAVTDPPRDFTHTNQNIAFIPTVDATQEFKIVTNFYDSQYGRTGGGIVSVTTKSGTNEYHGTVYDFLRRYQLDANNIAANAANPPRPIYAVDPVTGQNLGGHKLDQYGTQFGGPLSIPKVYNGKDRSFFMFSFENYHESTPSPGLGSVPTLAERNGDFSQEGITIYDPFSTHLNPAFDPTKADNLSNPRYIRDQFLNNMIPAQKLNAIGQNIVKAYPAPNTGAPNQRFNNFLSSPNLSKDLFRSYIGRVDQSFGQKERLFFRYAHNRRSQFDQGIVAFTGIGLDAQDPLVRVNDNAVMDSVTVLSPSMILDLRVGFARYIEQALRSHVYGFDATTIGFPASFSNARFDPIPPRIQLEQYSPDFGTRNQRYNVSNTVSFQPSLSFIKGRHSMKAGADIRDIRNNPASASTLWGGGMFHFNRDFTTRVPGSPENNVGSAVASLLIGTPDSGIISYAPRLAFRWGYYGIYFQDDIKVTSRLTVNAGLRWDTEGSPTERYNRQNRGWNFNGPSPLAAAAKNANASDCPACANLAGGLLFAGVNGNPREAFNTNYDHWQPRIGAAYQLAKRTVVRGGFGMFYLPESAYGGIAGFAADTNFVATTGGGVNAFIPANTLSNPFPAGPFAPTGSSQGLLTFAGQNVIFNNANRAIPHVNQFSFGIQHQLPWNVKAEASYVGSRSYDINTNDNQSGGARNLNVISADQLAKGRQDPSYLTQAVTNPFAGLLPGTNLNGGTVQRQLLLRPFPQFNNVLEGQESIGKIWYDSLQVSVEKRYTQGLILVAAYTWSKNIEQVAFLNNQDAAPVKNLTSNDRPQRLVLSGVYELPVGRGKYFAKDVGRGWNMLVGGWEYNFIGIIQSGNPVDLPGGVTRLSNPSVSDQSFNTWFNPCVLSSDGSKTTSPDAAHRTLVNGCSNPAWQILPPNTLRSTPFRSGSIRNPTAKQWDMSLNKRVYFTERYNFQVRLEAFNVFNTPIRSGLGTDPTSPNFGFVPAGQSNLPRQVQIGFKFNF